MKRILTTLLAVALLLGLGALAVLAMPNASAPLAAAPVVSAAAAAPEAGTFMYAFNAIALPLDVRSAWSGHYAFNAQGLAEYIGVSSVDQVLRLDAASQTYDSWYPAVPPDTGFGYVGGEPVSDPWALEVGKPYRIVLNGNDPLLSKLSLVGDVPPEDSVSFTLVGAEPGCKFNDIMVPLDQSSLVNADLLATSMGGASNVDQVLRLDASTQTYDSWYPAIPPDTGFGYVGGEPVTDPWEVKIGYPYAVCLKAGANDLPWP